MSVASVIRRGYADSVPSVVRRGYSATGAAPTLVGDAGPIKLVQNRPAVAFDLSLIYSGAGLSYSISPSVEAEASFNTSTGVLTWNPLNTGTFGPYTVTATNSSGSQASSAFTVTVQATALSGALFDSGLGFRLRVGL